MKRYYMIAEGRVQGVGFRYFCQINASNLNLTGWIRNMNNGMVEMEVQGEIDSLLKFFKIINKGNFFINVTSLSHKEKNIVENENKFKIRS